MCTNSKMLIQKPCLQSKEKSALSKRGSKSSMCYKKKGIHLLYIKRETLQFLNTCIITRMIFRIFRKNKMVHLNIYHTFHQTNHTINY